LIPNTASPTHRSGFVAVVGRPNVGKSTLVNAFLGQKVAIVSPKPQTTRHVQLGILTEPDYQVIFVDTPGMHEPRNPLGEYMVESAARALLDADAVLFIVDTGEPPNAADARLAERLRHLPGAKPVILALNKSDLLRPEAVLPNTNAYRELAPDAKWMLVSATRGDNLEPLREMIVAALPEGPALYPEDELTQTHLRDLAAELIREAALNTLEQEVPHGLAVEVVEYQERVAGPVFISANLYVERKSHKAIVIGKGGGMLKEIGSKARLEIEKLVEQKVYLELTVKVRENWRKDEQDVRRFGYRADK
jgi:GTP-binding protein Era